MSLTFSLPGQKQNLPLVETGRGRHFRLEAHRWLLGRIWTWAHSTSAVDEGRGRRRARVEARRHGVGGPDERRGLVEGRPGLEEAGLLLQGRRLTVEGRGRREGRP